MSCNELIMSNCECWCLAGVVIVVVMNVDVVVSLKDEVIMSKCEF